MSPGEYKPGEILAERYVIQGMLGRGGFGVVYKAFDGAKACAVKTFHDRYLADPAIRAQFKKEAQLWIDLGRSPYLVAAEFLLEEQGRFFIDMELVAPDQDGLSTLEGHIQRGAYSRAQALRWAIQFCRGMEHAYAKGVRCHRDIKPSNIMIASDGTLKISDFGLALLGKSAEHGGVGTPAFMPPEQWRDASLCDHRSDLYAFGVTLYQLFGKGRLPFQPQAHDGRVVAELRALHEAAAPPPLEDPLYPVIARCLEKAPERRWNDFSDLRARLEEALKSLTGEALPTPTPAQATGADWCNRGTSLCALKRYEEALACFEKALAIVPDSATASMDKGICLMELDRLDEALACFDRALAIQPDLAWAALDKGNVFDRMGRCDEALACYDRAIALRPNAAPGYFNKGSLLYDLGRFAEAFACHDQAVKNDPRHARAWRGRGHDLRKLKRLPEAVDSYKRGLAIEPTDASAWMALGQAYGMSKRPEEALAAFERSLELDPKSAGTWSDKGVALEMLGRLEESLQCHERALALDPKLERAVENRAAILRKLGR
jgi:tetratricopeptide (TPR) repeat protein